MNKLLKKGLYLFIILICFFFLLNLFAGNMLITSFIRAFISAAIVCMIYWIGRSIYILLFQDKDKSKGNNVDKTIKDDIKVSELIDEPKS